MDNFLSIIREAQARTVNGVFEQFLDREINIAKGIRGIASRSQNHLRDFLATEHRRDTTFPRVLSINDGDFLGGSFARHTKNWPLDDIDLYLPLDGHTLVYLSNGWRLPYGVVTDNVLNQNPLLTTRWMAGDYISSAKLINEFAYVLRRHYPTETDVYPNGQAVSIRMSHGASKSGDGLGYDVVPCFGLMPDDGNELPFYLMPDGSNGWMRTNPRIDNEIANALHANNDRVYRKIVRLIKYWNTNSLDGALGSYYIELAIARAFMEKNKNGTYIKSISHGLVVGFEALRTVVSQGNQTAWISNAPPVVPGSLRALHPFLVKDVAERAALAWMLEQTGNNRHAIKAWGEIFGPSFPEP
jgi:hypothetical protein